MAYPTELIRRARENRRMQRPIARSEAPEDGAERANPERATWQSRHGNYDRLMRSHDRLHPRHLDG